MRFTAAAASLAATASVALAQNDYSAEQLGNGAAFADLVDIANDNIRWNITNRPDQQCQFDDAIVRREWNEMSQRDRKSFTDAATCLMNHEPLRVTTDEMRNQYPGVRSRWDEFVATHIDMTMNIHVTADFLAWHRNFVHLLEEDLRNLCGYVSYMPYWNWAINADAPEQNPMFNGDEFSLGSNGFPIQDRQDVYLGLFGLTAPPGSGGGCIERGPFSDVTVNLGPLDSPFGDNVQNDQDYNPRCMTRDLNSFFSSRFLSWTNVTTLINDNIYLEDFQDVMQGYGGNDNPMGCHGGGHWALGAGTEMGDFHASPSDPVFFLHHAMIDRVWYVWQGQDIYRRQDVISGTHTLANNPPSDPMNLDEMISFGLAGDDVRFGDLMDTFAGPFCYRYE
ncbi:hypothetical protein MBLNU230_g4642t1 [Neophaeotheca triangularis]